jgi:hypothetical protein
MVKYRLQLRFPVAILMHDKTMCAISHAPFELLSSTFSMQNYIFITYKAFYYGFEYISIINRHDYLIKDSEIVKSIFETLIRSKLIQHSLQRPTGQNQLLQ